MSHPVHAIPPPESSTCLVLFRRGSMWRTITGPPRTRSWPGQRPRSDQALTCCPGMSYVSVELLSNKSSGKDLFRGPCSHIAANAGRDPVARRVTHYAAVSGHLYPERYPLALTSDH